MQLDNLVLKIKGEYKSEIHYTKDNICPRLISAGNPFNKINKLDFITSFLEMPGVVKLLI